MQGPLKGSQGGPQNPFIGGIGKKFQVKFLYSKSVLIIWNVWHVGHECQWTLRQLSMILRGFEDRWMDRQTDICSSRISFATENPISHKWGLKTEGSWVFHINLEAAEQNQAEKQKRHSSKRWYGWWWCLGWCVWCCMVMLWCDVVMLHGDFG